MAGQKETLHACLSITLLSLNFLSNVHGLYAIMLIEMWNYTQNPNFFRFSIHKNFKTQFFLYEIEVLAKMGNDFKKVHCADILPKVQVVCEFERNQSKNLIVNAYYNFDKTMT